MASGGGYAAMVWDLETGKIISAIPHEGIVQVVAVSTDGKTLASGDDKVAHVWDIKSGMEISRVTHGSVVDSVVFSTDGKYVVSGGYDRYARMWLWRSEDLIENACTFIPRNLTRDEWNQYLNGEAYQAICPNLPIELEPTQIP
jgi:WD40 repeat protein